jgi:hypothetical protein
MSEPAKDHTQTFMSFQENTRKCKGLMEQALYTAECACPNKEEMAESAVVQCVENCEFRKGNFCPLPVIRRMLGPSKH